MNSKKIILLGVLLANAGCATTAPPVQLIPGASNILVTKATPGDNYEIIGPVSSFDGKGCGGFGYPGSYERAITSLRNKTYNMDGHYIQIISLTEPHLQGDCFDNQFTIMATAYKKVRNQPSSISTTEAGEEKLTKMLRELKKLLDDNILSKEEYDRQKTLLLERGF